MSGRATTPGAVPVGRMSPFTVLPREQREARTRAATEPRPAYTGTSWMVDGACNDADPGLFQPIGEGAAYSQQIEDARAVCRECCVFDLCGEFSLETRQSSGIWAARTERDREQESRRRSRQRQQQARRESA